MGRRHRGSVDLQPLRPGPRAVGPCRAGCRVPRDDPHRQAPRRILSLAHPDHHPFGDEQPLAWGKRRRGARVRRCLSRRGSQTGPLSLAVGPEQRGVRRFPEVQRYLLRSAHRAPVQLRNDPRGLVRRRQRRRAQRQTPAIRLAQVLGPRPEAPARGGDLLRCRSRYPVDRERTGFRRVHQLVHRGPRCGAVPGRLG